MDIVKAGPRSAGIPRCSNLHLQILEAGNAVVVLLCGFLNLALFEKHVALLVDLRHKLEFLFVRHSPHIKLERSWRQNLSRERNKRPYRGGSCALEHTASL